MTRNEHDAHHALADRADWISRALPCLPEPAKADRFVLWVAIGCGLVAAAIVLSELQQCGVL